MTRALLLPALLLAAAGRAAAMSETLNPDRRNTVEFTEGGSSTMKGDQIVYGKGTVVDNNRRTLNVNASALALFPLSDAYTLTLGAGGNWNETDTAGGSGTNAADDDEATYQLGVRRYFEGSHSSTWPGSDNPDRWTSLGLTYSGLHTLNHSAGNANGNFTQDQASFNSTLAADVRIPLSSAWTALASLGGIDSYSKLEPTAAGTGAQTVTDTVSAGAGFRRYLVGKSLIMDDAELNPDKWIMFSLVLGGGAAVRSRQTITTQAGPNAGQRKNDSRFYSATLAARIPITDHMSLAFTTSGTYNRSFAPPLPNSNGALTRATPIAFTASLRYFIF